MSQNTYLTNQLAYSLLPFGSLDLGTCAFILNEAGVDFDDFAEYVTDPLKDLDICGLAFDYILNEARREIEEKTSVDILNDLDKTVYVYFNAMASSFDFEDASETIKTIKKIKKEDRSQLLGWFLNQIS